MEIIEHGGIEEVEVYRLTFEYTDLEGRPTGSGYGFECDADGNIDWDNVPMESLCKCIMGEKGLRYLGVVCNTYCYRQPAVGRCACGEEVELGGFTNTCECGRDYNWSGQELAPRSQWGEETGESLSDILNIP